MKLISSVHPTELAILFLRPALAADARLTPQDISRIDRPLDLQQPRVIVAPKRLLPVVFEDESLSRLSASAYQGVVRMRVPHSMGLPRSCTSPTVCPAAA